MRVVTRGDLDGLAGSVLLTLVEKVTEIRFAHPKDVQDGKFPCGAEDIVVNLPFVKGCGMWFDHHLSEAEKVDNLGKFKGRFAMAPSAARVIYDHYKSPAFEKHLDLLQATDRVDCGELSLEEVLHPKGWILLGLTLDPRTGLGPDFQKYFRWLVEFIKEVPMAAVLAHPEVKKRCDRVLKEQEAALDFLRYHTRKDGNVIVTDLRGATKVPVGNRFLVFTLHPEANVEARIMDGKEKKTVNVAIGHNIFNTTCRTNVGRLCASHGGGGHFGAGTVQIPPEKARDLVPELLRKLKENG